ncbi:SH3 domain-containing protein [Vitreimonas flagellata]|uniref:SH3 domain-containing protein n=1 Tax=Vitreimonas flagellata TaxID=2560861 RepID=UPI001074DBE4|nr:SH3 domain-containing protein [Vitreimonas flagellata]
MRKSLAGIVALIVVCLAMAATAQQMSFSGTASVIDGDTIEIHNRPIRLSGFDAPERGKYCGRTNVYQRASLALAEAIAQRLVSCTQTGEDAHGRAVAVCRVGQRDLGDYMVSLGWARDWPRYSNGAYAQAEAAARRDRLGIWGMECPSDVWSNRDYETAAVEPPTPAATMSALQPTSRETAYVTASALNVRAGPAASSVGLGRVDYGARLEILERRDGWARINYNGADAWVSADFLSASEPVRRAGRIGDGENLDSIRRLIVQESIAHYSGRCPCPYNVMRNGRRCGNNSAYSRPGGASPICYPSDVTEAHVRSFLARRAR